MVETWVIKFEWGAVVPADDAINEANRAPVEHQTVPSVVGAPSAA